MFQGVNEEEIFSKLGIFFICIVRIMPSFLRIYNIVYTINFLKSSISLIKQEIVNEEKYLKEVSKEDISNKSIDIKKIKISNLSYKYPSSKTNVIENLNFEFKKGQVNTIIGNSGSGKTTLLNIILGLIKTEKGKIVVNNEDFTNQKLYENLKVGYVPQNIFLFDDSIRNNISFLDESNNIENDLVRAAKSSEILSFINSLQDKFDHRLGEKGSNISGGQIQRIGLARALYPNPDIIILDEFTSSVDLETEKKLMETLQKLKDEKLIIIISHREQTIKFSDNVLNLSKKEEK